MRKINWKILFKKKYKDTDCCRFCQKSKYDEEKESFVCEIKGIVSGGDVCRKFKFNPLAPRTRRIRNIDTTMFDPVEFKID